MLKKLPFIKTGANDVLFGFFLTERLYCILLQSVGAPNEESRCDRAMNLDSNKGDFSWYLTERQMLASVHVASVGLRSGFV